MASKKNPPISFNMVLGPSIVAQPTPVKENIPTPPRPPPAPVVPSPPPPTIASGASIPVVQAPAQIAPARIDDQMDWILEKEEWGEIEGPPTSICWWLAFDGEWEMIQMRAEAGGPIKMCE